MTLIDSDWLLDTPLARTLYEAAAAFPTVDYHNHLSPDDLATDRRYDNLTQLWLANDPYKHRAMRMLGIPEAEITGSHDDRRLFDYWAHATPRLIGNPLHQWGRLELFRALGIESPLSPGSATQVWSTTRERLAQPDFTARRLVVNSGCVVACTSDRLLDDLTAHRALAQNASNDETRVLPSLRGDDVLALGSEPGRPFLEALTERTGAAIHGFDALEAVIEEQLDHFAEHGATLADHGLDRIPPTPSDPTSAAKLFETWCRGRPLNHDAQANLQVALLTALGRSYRRRGWAMLLHIGAQRQTSARLAQLAGPAGGYAAAGSSTDIAALAGLLNHLETHGALPRTVLFNLNPADNAAFATLTGSFTRDHAPGYVSWGPAWWYADHARGIVDHLENTANYGLLWNFPGMTTDARSPLSMHRHEYFRRLFCGWLGRQARDGLIPDDRPALQSLLRAVLVDNPARLLGLNPHRLKATNTEAAIA